MRRFTKEHEWVDVEGDVATVGITAYAAEQLGDIVYVDLPKVGSAVTQMGPMAVVESVKAASDVYAPLTGEIVAANESLSSAPEKVNETPEGEAWFAKIKLKAVGELDALMDADAYTAFLKTL
jgi:glycine cleavage system H protein